MDKSYERKEKAAQLLGVIKTRWPRLYMAMVNHRTTTGEQMIFGDKPWLRQIYQDESHEMVIIKCSQVHMTEHALCAMFTYAAMGKRGMYILPSKEHRKTFVKDRIDAQKASSPEYARAIKQNYGAEGDSNVYKSIYGSGWKYVGSNVKKDFFEFPCSVLFFDEYDELVEDNIQYAYDRVENEPDPIIWKFGNPTFDGMGIHAEWLDSDQKEWMVRCEHCGHEHILDWYKHFVKTDVMGHWKLRNRIGRPICENCGQDFNRLNDGRWVAQNPSSPISGYRISRLFVHKGKKPNDIVFLFRKFLKAQGNSVKLQVFHNNYLGVPYSHSEDKLTDVLLNKASQQYQKMIDTMAEEERAPRAVMGVDQGKHFTCTISIIINNVVYDIHYANVKRWYEIEQLENEFNVTCTVIDANGGGYAETRDFVNGKGTRWMCYYLPKDRVTRLYDLQYDKQVVNTNRTEACDTMVKYYKQGRMGITPDYQRVDDKRFYKQMLAPNRTQDAGGRPIWTKAVDHYFHSAVYRTIALLISGMGDSRATRKSWRTNTPVVKKRAELEAQVIGDFGKALRPKPKAKSQSNWRV